LSVACAALLPVDRAACEWFARRLAAHHRTIGTRKGTRRLTPWSQAVFVLRFLIDGTRIAQLTADNALARTTAYDNLWEGLEVLAEHAPSPAEAIDAARAASDGHIGLDGTLIPTCRIQVEPMACSSI
jgi:phage terminase large subunit